MGSATKRITSGAARRQRELEGEVKKVMTGLGLDRMERVMVAKCADCPFLRSAGEHRCKIGLDVEIATPDWRPPKKCPLRKAAVSVAIDPEA
jgi:hypothetical protein